MDDGRCDCPGDCADESAWSCDNCNCGFPCGDSRGQPPCAEQFVCPGGCVIGKSKLNDLVCDCPESCADETELGLDCIQCFGRCPSSDSCGQRPPPCRFRCDDGCLIPPFLQGDDYCDCPDCSEEASQGFLCNTEPGGLCECPSTCDFANFISRVKCQPEAPPGRFACSDGCLILSEYLNDAVCDCSDCGDEPRYTCDNCTCPTFCGVWTCIHIIIFFSNINVFNGFDGFDFDWF